MKKKKDLAHREPNNFDNKPIKPSKNIELFQNNLRKS